MNLTIKVLVPLKLLLTLLWLHDLLDCDQKGEQLFKYQQVGLYVFQI